MHVFEFVLAIVGIVMGTAIIKSWIARKHAAGNRTEDLAAGLEELGIDGQLRKIDQLEERIRVLERLATDDGAKLARDIDSL